MKIAIRYYSKSGNTEKLAKVIEETLKVDALSINEPLNEDVDILFLGSSIYASGLSRQVKKFIKSMDVKPSKVVCFGTSAYSPSTYKSVKKQLDAKGIKLDTREFHCKGQFAKMNVSRPNQDDLQAIRIFVKEIVENV